MGLNKQGYYTLKDILPYNADYNIILSGRSIGKSYATEFEKAFKYEHLKESQQESQQESPREFMGALRLAWERKECTLGYVRRMREDIQGQNCAEAFMDKLTEIEKMTGGECNFVTQKSNNLWLSHVDENGKIKLVLNFGKIFAISEVERYKSRQFPTITIIIFEEFVTKNRYLPREVSDFQNLISTIARDRKIYVFMIANTISQTCPYFSEWGLANIPKQKIGTIDRYFVKGTDMAGNERVAVVCVEYAESVTKENAKRKSFSQVFIGKAQKSITGGAWETENYPHLYDIEWDKDEDDQPIIDYDTIARFLYECDLHTFVIELRVNNQNGGQFVFVYPANKDKLYEGVKRFCQFADVSDYTKAIALSPIKRTEEKTAELIRADRVCFSDNLTGQNFYNCLKIFNIL